MENAAWPVVKGYGREMMFSVWMNGSQVHVCADEKPAKGRQAGGEEAQALQGRREGVGGLEQLVHSHPVGPCVTSSDTR